MPLARLVPPIGFHPILRESLLAQPGLAPLLQHRHRLLPPKVHRNSTFYPSGRYLAASCHLILRPPGSLLVAAHALRSADQTRFPPRAARMPSEGSAIAGASYRSTGQDEEPYQRLPPLCPFRIAVIRFVGTSRALASALADNPSSSSSSANISPGCTGLIPLLILMPNSSSMVVHDLHVVRSVIFPTEAYSPLAVDPDAVLARSVAGESLQPVAGQSGQIL